MQSRRAAFALAYVTTSLLAGVTLIPSIAHADLFVVSEGNGNPGTGSVGQYVLGATPGTIDSSIPFLISGLNTPVGITVAGSQLFVANDGSGTIGEYTLGATPGSITFANPSLITNLPGVFDIASSGSNLFTANFNRVGEYTTSGGNIASSLFTYNGDLFGIAVSGSTLFVSSFSNGTIGEYSTSGAVINATLVSGLSSPRAIAVSGSNLFVTNAGSGTVGEYTLGATPGTLSAATPVLISGLNSPDGIAISGSNLFVASAGSGTVGEYTLATTPGTITSSTPALISGLAFPAGIFIPNDLAWASPADGDWDTATNWSPLSTPTSTNDLYFTTKSSTPYAVSLVTTSAANNFTVNGDAVTIKLAGNVLSIGGSVTVSGSAAHPSALTFSGANPLPIRQDVIVSGNLSVQTSDDPKNASLTIDGATVAGNVTTNAKLDLRHNASIIGSVNNSGVLSTFSGTTIPAGNSIMISGNYTQQATGVLKMQIAGTGSSQFDQLFITGKASLDGTLDISYTGQNAPALGDTFPIITYSSLAGRFKTFTGAIIKNADGIPIPAASDEFFGLLYGANTLSVATLKVPIRATGGLLNTQNAKGLVLVTHGWLSNSFDWAGPMAQSIQAGNAARGVSQNWDVVSMDWSDYANTALPTTAAENANDIGESLANWMREKGFSYSDVHVIGHSAGSWLINGLTNGLKTQDSSTFVQQTYLDAYNSGFITLNGYSSGNVPVLGLNADFAEQYFDGNHVVSLDGLATTLPNAVNYDVQNLTTTTSYTPVGVHQWPYQWYELTVLTPNGFASANGFGFAQSIEFSGQPQYGITTPYSRNDRVTLPSGIFINHEQFNLPTDILAAPHVTSGSVQSVAPGTVQFFAPGSTQPPNPSFTITPASALTDSPSNAPAILTDELDLTAVSNLLDINGQFLSSGHGLLTVYFDGTQITQIDERDMGSDPFLDSDVYLGSDAQPGIHTLMFRLDAFDNLDSTLNITNVQLGMGVRVPEPSNLALLFTGAALLLLPRRRKITNVA